jgi:Putative zinc-finger
VSGHPCPERLLLPEALSGRLDPAEEKRVMAHLQTCPTCQDAAADIEISLISLAVLRDEDALLLRPNGAGPESSPDPELSTPSAVPLTTPAPSRESGGDGAEPPWRRRLPAIAAAAAAAVVFAAAGLFVGHSLLPPTDRPDFGPAVALAPPPGAADAAARGTVAVASEGNALAVRLNASALPKTGWYECVWVADGQSRSAGSFRAADGVVKNVELRVAQPQDATGWDLQLIHHEGDVSEIVLEGDVHYS